MSFPHTIEELLQLVAKETARMSYPSSMSRGKSPIVRKGTKKVLERFYSTRFPIAQVHQSAGAVAEQYDEWHSRQVQRIASAIKGYVYHPYRADSVASKFLNTYMHQLMKYEWARPLLPMLHLPLDSRVLGKLKKMKHPALKNVSALLECSAYTLMPKDHRSIQRALRDLIGSLNARANVEFKIGSRVELNLLWL